MCEIKCKRHACAIQRCLSRLPVTKSQTSSSTLNFGRCDDVKRLYDECCLKARALEAKEAEERA